MKIWVVYGTYNDFDGEDWIYACCSTEEIAERELVNAKAETDDEPDFLWGIIEMEVITK